LIYVNSKQSDIVDLYKQYIGLFIYMEAGTKYEVGVYKFAKFLRWCGCVEYNVLSWCVVLTLLIVQQ
jgi:hypothetical protein